jgi:SpoIIAA-like
MPIEMHHESDDTYRLDISGVLRRTEFKRCETELAKELDRVRSAKLLCVLQQFDGWEPDADGSDLGFYIKHGDAISRIAIVGDERWRDLMMMFSAADLRKATVEFFPANEIARARDWLAS